MKYCNDTDRKAGGVGGWKRNGQPPLTIPQRQWIFVMPNAAALKRGRPPVTRPGEAKPPALAEIPMTSFMAKAIRAARLEESSAGKPPKAVRANPATSEMDYSGDELEFLKTVDEYKRIMRKPFLTNTEYFGLMVKRLGYRKT